MLTNFPNGITSFGVPVLGTIGGLPFTGNYYFVDPVNGADGNEGTPELPLKTLYGALAKCTAGNNDVVVLMGDGSSTGSARLSTALAQTIDSSATAGTLNWNKNATHLIGVAAPTMVAQRARIAPPTGTYTQATFNSLAFINVTASGCYFANLSVFCGFSTGANGMIAWTDSGSRNAYSNVNIFGMADSTSAAGANSRSLKSLCSLSTLITLISLRTLATLNTSAANGTRPMISHSGAYSKLLSPSGARLLWGKNKFHRPALRARGLSSSTILVGIQGFPAARLSAISW